MKRALAAGYVFRLLAAGKSNRQIAAGLFVAETTVKTHVARILSKLKVRDRIQALILAYDIGLVVSGDAEA